MLTRLVLDLPDGPCDAVVGGPPDGRPRPPVLFVMDAIGLRPQLDTMVERLAGLGYTVLAPNVYYRAGRPRLIDPGLFAPERGPEFTARMMSLLRRYTDAMWERDGPAYLDALAARDDTTDDPVRVVGYCMGGRLGLQLAAQCPQRVSHVAGYHTGGLVTDAPDSPHRRLDRVRAAVYYLFADRDGSMPPEARATLAQAAETAGCDYAGELASGALHGFTMADRPVYDAAADARHWATLAAHFGAPRAG